MVKAISDGPRNAGASSRTTGAITDNPGLSSATVLPPLMPLGVAVPSSFQPRQKVVQQPSPPTSIPKPPLINEPGRPSRRQAAGRNIPDASAPITPSPAAVPSKDETETEAPQAPQWLVDLRFSNWKNGFLHSDDAFTAVFIERQTKHLLVSFTVIPPGATQNQEVEPWGYQAAAKPAWSHLGIVIRGGNPDYSAALQDFLTDHTDLFSRFDKVTLTGSLEGGCVAYACSQLAKGADTIIFSPRPMRPDMTTSRRVTGGATTRRKKISDGQPVIVIHDPQVRSAPCDANWSKSSDLLEFPIRHSGANVALGLEQAGLFDDFLHQLAGQSVSRSACARMRRQLRSTSWYLEILAKRAANRPVALRKIADVARQSNHNDLAERLSQDASALIRSKTATDRNKA